VERAEADAIFEQGRDAVVAVLVALAERIAVQDVQVAKLTARLEELERRLNRSSRNSSLPPSQDPPGTAKRKQQPSGREPGGQPGHPGHGRRLQPLERVDEIVEHWPGRCGCGRVFGEAERVAAGAPARRQVAELPPVTVVVTEHRLHRVCCPGCGQVSRAELPAGIPSGAFGPRLQAAVATLAVRNRVSRRDLVELVGELFGCPISTGTVDAIVQRTGEALEQPYQTLLAQVRAAPAVNVDETGWRLRGGKRTLWGAFTQTHALLRVAPDRHQRELEALLGEAFAGIACSDRWWAYNQLAPERRQVCWSHLVRDFTAHSEDMAARKELGETGLRIADKLFDAWKIYKHDGDRRALKRRAAPLKRELRALLETNATKRARNRYTRTISNNLLKLWPALWTFVDIDGVEPTNNHAERGLRGAVIHRKLSHGSQSDQGEQTIERLLTASITCRLQKRSLHTYLTQVITAHTRSDPIPALT